MTIVAAIGFDFANITVLYTLQSTPRYIPNHPINIMEISIRLMMVMVVSLIVVLIVLAIIFNLGGDAMGGFRGIFDWIMGMGPEPIK